MCARYPGVIKQILTHHAYTALYLLPPTDRPVTLSAFRSTIREDDQGTAPQENHTMVNMMTAGEFVNVKAIIYAWQAQFCHHGCVLSLLCACWIAYPGGAMVHLCASFAADDHSADPWCVHLCSRCAGSPNVVFEQYCGVAGLSTSKSLAPKDQLATLTTTGLKMQRTSSTATPTLHIRIQVCCHTYVSWFVLCIFV